MLVALDTLVHKIHRNLRAVRHWDFLSAEEWGEAPESYLAEEDWL